MTYGTHVHVHELGFSECAKAYVFQVRPLCSEPLKPCEVILDEILQLSLAAVAPPSTMACCLGRLVLQQGMLWQA